MSVMTRHAPAKINLTLHVTGQRPDGYHLLDSLVVFVEAGDLVTLDDGAGLTLALQGPGAAALAVESDNLILRAARLAGAQDAAFTLDKYLPVASGMGGGSSDAAAALHLLAETRGMALPGMTDLMRLGADLPVCMQAPRPARMRGLGEILEPLPACRPCIWCWSIRGRGCPRPPCSGRWRTRPTRRCPRSCRVGGMRAICAPGWPECAMIWRRPRGT